MLTCPRAVENGPEEEFAFRTFKYENKPDDGTCGYCGSLLGDVFMARLEAGDISLDPTHKSYKVYVYNEGGEAFQQASRTDKPSVPGEVMKDPMDQSHWTWEVQDRERAKFYFQHLTEEQQKRFVELLNEKKIKIKGSGHFSAKPFFINEVG